MEFKERFGQLVEEKKMKGKDIAAAIGVSTAEVSKLLNYDREPSAYTLKNTAKFFDVSVDWLLGLSDIRSTKPVRRAECRKLGLSEKAIDFLVNEVKNEHKGLPCFALIGVNMLFEQEKIEALQGYTILECLGHLAEIIYDDVEFEKINGVISSRKRKGPITEEKEIYENYYISKYIDHICLGLKQLCEQKTNINKNKLPEPKF